jgi:hypothetical protein
MTHVVEYSRKENIWFKRKLYGWGWTPITWQGWLVTATYAVLVIVFALSLDKDSPKKEVVFTFVLPVLLLTISLIRLAYRKGERPRWQWGKDIV